MNMVFFNLYISFSFSFINVFKFSLYESFVYLVRFILRFFLDYYEWYCFSDFFHLLFVVGI